MLRNEEQSLIRRIKRRQDKKAADALIRMYYKEIYVYVYRQLGEKEQAMDITQDVFLSMLQSIWNYDPKKAGFRTWLYRIATYKIVDYYRSPAYRHLASQLPLEEIELKEEWNVEWHVTNREMIIEIFRYLRSKDALLEEIFRLKFYGEYTFEEIGTLLSLPASTIKTKYYAAQKAIRREFL